MVAAIELAQAGKSVVLIEKAKQLGGRAISVKKNEAIFNLGGHAVIRGGQADQIFRDLGVKIEGGSPSANISVLWNNQVTPMFKFILSRNLRWSGKLELVKTLAKIAKIDANAVPAVSLRNWVERQIRDPMVRHIVYAMLRVGSFTQDPDYQLAGPAVGHVARTSGKNGIVYVAGGWQTIVDQLHALADRAGVCMMTGTNVTGIEHDGAVRKIRLADGREMEISYVISATPPAVTSRLLGEAASESVLRWKQQAREVAAACLDLALKRLPVPNRFAVLGIDQPIYFGNQSKFTRLSEDGTPVVSIVKHNGVGGTDAKADERFLEQMMDLIQPGWRKEVIARQYLPNMVVAHDYMHIGRKDRFPGPAVPEIAGLYVAGEWASHGELLSDAAAASGRRAARCVLKDMEAWR